LTNSREDLDTLQSSVFDVTPPPLFKKSNRFPFEYLVITTKIWYFFMLRLKKQKMDGSNQVPTIKNGKF